MEERGEILINYPTNSGWLITAATLLGQIWPKSWWWWSGFSARAPHSKALTPYCFSFHDCSGPLLARPDLLCSTILGPFPALGSIIALSFAILAIDTPFNRLVCSTSCLTSAKSQQKTSTKICCCEIELETNSHHMHSFVNVFLNNKIIWNFILKLCPCKLEIS